MFVFIFLDRFGNSFLKSVLTKIKVKIHWPSYQDKNKKQSPNEQSACIYPYICISILFICIFTNLQ